MKESGPATCNPPKNKRFVNKKANGWTPCIELFALGQTPIDCLKGAKGTIENFGEKNILINYMRQNAMICSIQ